MTTRHPTRSWCSAVDTKHWCAQQQNWPGLKLQMRIRAPPRTWSQLYRSFLQSAVSDIYILASYLQGTCNTTVKSSAYYAPSTCTAPSQATPLPDAPLEWGTRLLIRVRHTPDAPPFLLLSSSLVFGTTAFTLVYIHTLAAHHGRRSTKDSLGCSSPQA